MLPLPALWDGGQAQRYLLGIALNDLISSLELSFKPSPQ